jgi:hypothetical protein
VCQLDSNIPIWVGLGWALTASVIGPHVPAHLRGAADLPLLWFVDVERQRLERRALHAVVREARVVVPPFLRRGLEPRRAAGQAASADGMSHGWRVRVGSPRLIEPRSFR